MCLRKSPSSHVPSVLKKRFEITLPRCKSWQREYLLKMTICCNGGRGWASDTFFIMERNVTTLVAPPRSNVREVRLKNDEVCTLDSNNLINILALI